MKTKKKSHAKKRSAATARFKRKTRPKDVKPHYLSLEYSGGLWTDLDLLLRRHAKRFGGKEIGSGFSFTDGTRDLQFEFKDGVDRREFTESVRVLGSIFVTLRDDRTDS